MFTKVFSLFVALVAAVVLLSAPSAAIAKAQKGRIDVSTRAAVVTYLRSIHINPRGVVIERGARNYAGASCPGRRWICTTTTHPVVQVAPRGGRNAFRCSTANCVVVQVANLPVTATNTASCIRTSGSTQTCTIDQNSVTANNKAVVYENITSSVGLTQNATSTASITQTATGPANASNSNEACVYQAVSLDSSRTTTAASVPVTQSADQTVTIKQNSANGGNSAAESATPLGQCTTGSITQRQTLSSTITATGSVVQNQNAGNAGADMTIDIEQNQSSGFLGSAYGANSADFDQYNALTAVANTPAGPVSQTQSSVNGGVLGTVNQDSRDLSTAVTTQTEIQCEDAAMSGLTTCHTVDPDASEAPSSLTQTQFGPIRKGVGQATQTGNGSDTFAINQTSKQDDDQGAGSNQTNVVQADCTTDGFCTVEQNVDVDGSEYFFSFGGSSIDTTTTCTGDVCSNPNND